ncbi:hypothetical protein KSP40_PGU016798 [Platanthera guangdongensis]|uniref:Transcription repressor n=1 Tax=Platanthera guangdongensis TaxID=2320717 RepID=A0ABR2M4Q6_9ASPA
MLGCFTKPRRPSPILPPLSEPSSQAVPSASKDSGDPSIAVFTDFNSPTGSSSQSPTLDDLDPISSAMASPRLFLASPGRSNSIIDSAAVFVGVSRTGVAVPTYSPDPYLDFRRSMEEMVVALGVGGPGSHLDHIALRELLLCYLSLNRKNAHKYIFTAFVDLLLALSDAARDS